MFHSHMLTAIDTMRLQIIFLFLLFTGHFVIGQVKPFEKYTFEYYVSSSTASDTNSLSFLKSTYNDCLNSRTSNDRVAVFLEVSEDDIFYSLSNHHSFESDLYELEIYNLRSKKSKTGGLQALSK